MYNGFVKSTHIYRRIANLIESIPLPFRLQTAQACIPADGNVHDWERKLTGACLSKAWEPQIVNGVSSAAWFEAQPEQPL